MKTKVIFGGCFDPFHNGHSAILREVINLLLPAEIHIIPCNIQPTGKIPVASGEDRLEMCRLALKKYPNSASNWCVVDDREILRGGLSFTADTLREVVYEIGERPSLVVGMDEFLTLDVWKDIEEYPDLVSRIVRVGRRGYNQVDKIPEWLQSALQLGLMRCSDVHLSAFESNISSSEVRRKITNGDRLTGLVYPEVEEYIKEHKLYQGE